MKRPPALLVLLVAVCLGGAGCARLRELIAPAPPGPPPKPPLLVEVAPDALPPFADDADLGGLRACLRRSLDQFTQLPAERTYATPAGPVRLADLERGLTLFLQALDAAPPPVDWRAWIAGRFRVLRADPDGGVLFTGYYQPELRAAREPSATFAYPLYRTPDDLVHVEQRDACPSCDAATLVGRSEEGEVVPYYSRAEIDGGGALGGRELELAWVESPIELFFLHVQGSGLLRFDDGTAMQVGFAASNGRPYRSIGKLLVESGKVPLQTASLETLRQYLRDHPEERDAILFSNERYVFFRPLPIGPIGSLGVPLTPGRSVAVDPAVYPLGSLLWIDSERPAEAGGALPLERFVCAQDAGAAIAGPGRIDVFWGAGVEAERIAGPMRARGEVYLLLPR